MNPFMLRIDLACAAALAVCSAGAAADEFVVTPLGPPVEFQQPVEGGAGAFQVDRTIEASAAATVGDGGRLVVAHDKAVPLRLVETATGREVKTLTSPRFPAETPKSTKWEAMAQDADGGLYVVGSHSGKTEDERAQHRSLIRFHLVDGPDGLPTIDDASVVSWALDAGLERALRSLGLSDGAVARRKVEGLTIREPASPNRRELVVGLREPDDLVRAFVVHVPTSADGAPLEPTPLFAFEPGEIDGVRRQLTSLEYVPAWRGFAIVTATEDADNAFHGNTLWFASDDRIARADGATITPEKVWEFEPAMKAEGLCILPTPGPGPDADPATATVRFAIVYDNDAHVTGSPGRSQVVDVAHRASVE